MSIGPREFKEFEQWEGLSLRERIAKAIEYRKKFGLKSGYDIICCRPTQIDYYLISLLEELDGYTLIEKEHR